MNCKTIFRGPLSVNNIREMSNDTRYALVSFLFDNRSSLSIPAGYFTCFFKSPGYIPPLDLYYVCRASNLDSAVIVKQYHRTEKYRITVNSHFSNYVF